MTKQEILERFKDIDFMYNDSSRLDTLSRMIDELLQSQPQIVRCKDCRHRTERICTNIRFYECNHLRYEFEKVGVDDDWFCADGEPKAGDDS